MFGHELHSAIGHGPESQCLTIVCPIKQGPLRFGPCFLGSLRPFPPLLRLMFLGLGQEIVGHRLHPPIDGELKPRFYELESWTFGLG